MKYEKVYSIYKDVDIYRIYCECGNYYINVEENFFNRLKGGKILFRCPECREWI